MTDDDRFNIFVNRSNIEVKKYQYDGVLWCANLEREGRIASRSDRLDKEGEGETSMRRVVKGGFIADEMGLGKTITMIALFFVNFVPRTLIVVPKVLIHQWRAEIFRTTGHKALVYHGSDKSKITMDTLRYSPFVITTYHMCAVKRVGVNDAGCLLHKIKWNRIVFDEAHHLRNKNNLYLGSSKLKSDIRWMVSGTPIQNKMKDFYNLCELLGMQSSYYADETYFDDLQYNFVLKRTKMDVGLALPQLIVENNDIDWLDVDERILSQKIHQALVFADNKTRLQLYLFARQCCILPALLKGKTITQNAFCESATSKLDAVISKILSRLGNGCGKLIFCHFREEIDFVVAKLKAGGMNDVCAFDGRSSTGARNKMLNGGYEAIVLQIQTGCEGLNLQKDFSEIYFVSPHWNPAIEDQAIARCHRFGQVKDVYVFRFCMDKIDVSENVAHAVVIDGVEDVDLDVPVALAVPYSTEEKQYLTTLDKYICTVQERKRETYL